MRCVTSVWGLRCPQRSAEASRRMPLFLSSALCRAVPFPFKVFLLLHTQIYICIYVYFQNRFLCFCVFLINYVCILTQIRPASARPAPQRETSDCDSECHDAESYSLEASIPSRKAEASTLQRVSKTLRPIGPTRATKAAKTKLIGGPRPKAVVGGSQRGPL